MDHAWLYKDEHHEHDHEDYEEMIKGYWAWSLGEHDEEKAFLDLQEGGKCEFKTREHEPFTEFGEDYCNWHFDPWSFQLRLHIDDHIQGDFVNQYTDNAWLDYVEDFGDDHDHDDHIYHDRTIEDIEEMVEGTWGWSIDG